MIWLCFFIYFDTFRYSDQVCTLSANYILKHKALNCGSNYRTCSFV